MKVYIKTLNICPMRRVNTTQYREALLQNGHELVDTPEKADKVLVWTCAVRGDFHDNSISVLKDFESRGFSVVAAGCLPSIDPSEVENNFHGEIIHYNNDREEFAKVFGVEHMDAPYPVVEAPIPLPIDEYKKLHPELKIGNDDQYIKIFLSEGCTRLCTYCTEVRAFPPYRSFPKEKLVAKAREMVEKTEVKNIALFGDDIGAYGVDTGTTLIELIRELKAIHPDVRISLKQIHPAWCLHYTEELSALVKDGTIFQALVPIQSANDRVLAAMKRGYTKEELHTVFNSIFDGSRVELETHVIAGFPTETSEEWEETVEFILQYRFRYVMGNIFMAGPNTEAAAMDGQVNRKEKERRILDGADRMETNGTVVGHDLSARSKEHTTLNRIDLMEL
ncbi:MULTISPECIES: radical SAM protein [unclassified Pseudodesulfovibrio]|uniref:radical SAM protein n=1 Tax=unclassified Pseudodesulfovibrio TaxID=2661612 RepID=UPI000FEBDDEC|nr:MULTISPECIES: radical SAM protein [unclassified Pseudodesulfovibrio]MCJ2163220.1 radical SAM protein [Pseudodesulfovibrio sp. S3-i]RWU07203.1 radical SAM protein [Pseudodesulfovibrio sp. S3]